MVQELFESDQLASLALYIGSPSIWLAGAKSRGDKSNKPINGLFAYATRMATRATPFGLFSGVALVGVGEATDLSVAGREQIRTRTRLDMTWLGRFIASIEKDMDARRNCHTYTNELVFERGGRLFVGNPENTYNAREGTSRAVRFTPVSFRNTEIVRFICARSKNGIRFSDLAEGVVNSFQVDLRETESLLNKLWDAGLLVSTLRPSPIGSPFVAFCSKLLASAHSAVEALAELGAAIEAIDLTPVPQRSVGQYQSIEARMNKLISSDVQQKPSFLQTDTALAFRGKLGKAILSDVAALSSIFLRCSQLMELKDYRQRFIDRYEGYERTVPLLELVDPAYGLGVPEALTAAIVANSAIRDGHLSDLIATAITAGLELTLSTPDLEQILPGMPNRTELPSSIEIGFRIVSESLSSINDGHFSIAPGSLVATDAAGASAGRFLDVLGAEAEARLTKLLSYERTEAELDVELVYFPSGGRGANVAIRPSLHPYELRIGLPPSDNGSEALPLSDLYVRLEEGRFVVLSHSKCKRIRIRESHLLNTMVAGPPICRFLMLAARDRRRAVNGFDWGKYSSAAFLPRLRWKNIVFSLARWSIPRSPITNNFGEFTALISRWRHAYHMPRFVNLVQADNLLLIDLDTVLGIELLFERVRQGSDHQDLVLEEMYPGFGSTWFEGSDGTFLPEFVISAVAVTSPRPNNSPPLTVVEPADRIRSPNSDWLYSKCYVGESVQDIFLRDAVAPLINRLRMEGSIQSWFFVRFADPLPHLRIRLQKSLSPGALSVDALIAEMDSWLTCGILERVEIATYSREIERYGGVEAMSIVESIFAWDSDNVLVELQRAGTSNRLRMRACLKTLKQLILAIIGPDVSQWLARRRPAGLKLSTSERDDVKSLLSTTSRSHIVPDEISRVGGQLRQLAQSKRINASWDEIVESITHMHINRFGFSTVAEVRLQSMLWQLMFSDSRRASMRFG